MEEAGRSTRGEVIVLLKGVADLYSQGKRGAGEAVKRNEFKGKED